MKGKTMRKIIVMLMLSSLVLASCSHIDEMQEMIAVSQKISEEISQQFDTECSVYWNLKNNVLTCQIALKSPPESVTVGELTSQVKKIIADNTDREYSRPSIIIGDMPPKDD